ncbi:MAG: hypothetical protein NVV62_03670 [Terricaulis sp.]|nr:hypothetical protein [Terricaulis sp.]
MSEHPRSIWPYLLAPIVFAAYFAYENYVRALPDRAATQPNEGLGQIWQITYRGGVVHYVQFWDYLAFNLPVIAVLIVISLAALCLFALRKKRPPK